jgi:hypothetical protein
MVFLAASHEMVQTMSNAPATLPQTPDDFHKRMLEAAGLGEPDQVRLLKRVLESAEADLSATKETPISYMGELKDVHTQPDYSARSKAREQIIDLIGVKHKPTPVAPQRQPVELPLAPWMQSLTISVKPQPAVQVVQAPIVEAESVSSVSPETP